MRPTPTSDEQEAGFDELIGKLRDAESIEEYTAVIALHGWTVPLVLLGIIGIVRGIFEYFADPFVISEGYRFVGWPLALFANLVYGYFIVLFAWFMFFGVIGAFAGYLSDAREMDAAMFKVGSYLSTLFVPVFLLGALIILTVSVPEGVTAVDAHQDDPSTALGAEYVHDTIQYHVISIFRAIAWAIIGFLMLPIVEQRYELNRRRSVLAVLPTTLAAIFATQLI